MPSCCPRDLNVRSHQIIYEVKKRDGNKARRFSWPRYNFHNVADEYWLRGPTVGERRPRQVQRPGGVWVMTSTLREELASLKIDRHNLPSRREGRGGGGGGGI